MENFKKSNDKIYKFLKDNDLAIMHLDMYLTERCNKVVLDKKEIDDIDKRLAEYEK